MSKLFTVEVNRCWDKAKGDHVAFADYIEEMERGMQRAKKQGCILVWDEELV